MSKEFVIDSKEMNELVAFANVNNVAYDVFEGVLQDNFIFYGVEDLLVSKGESETDLLVVGDIDSCLIVEERYVNEWTSELVARITDSKEEIEEFESRFDDELG